MPAIRSANELYAHAIVIEREAAERYSELAVRMADLGNEAVAELFGRLAGFEAEHLETLLRRTDGVEVPDDLMAVLSEYATHGSPARRTG